MKRIRFLFFGLLASIALRGVAGAGPVIPVQEGESIQEAIDAAPAGSTVEVSPGTYLENLNLRGKAIHLRSTHGPEATVLDASHSIDPDRASVVTFESGEGPDSVLEGFTLTGGTGTAIEREQGTLRVGGGVLCLGTSPRIVGCMIFRNHAETGGGGAFCEGPAAPVFSDCTFWLNLSDLYGAGIGSNGGSPVVDNCRFFFNRAGLGGGAGAFGLGADAVLARCRMFGNASYQGAAVYVKDGTARLDHCVLSDNSASSEGGAIYAVLASFHLDSCTLYNNSGALRGGGGALRGALGSASNSIIASNRGSAFSLVADASVSLTFCDVWGNVRGAYEASVPSISPEDGNLETDPLLTRDGHLTSLSPCRGAGPDLSLPQTDIDGEPRPPGSMDMGADAFLDSDGDLLPDSWEVRNGLSPAASGDTHQDPDGDGVANLDEYRLDGDPLLSDAVFTASGERDEDRDGLSNRQERILFGLRENPEQVRERVWDRDADGDGFPDGLEVFLGEDPADEHAYPELEFGPSEWADEDQGSGDRLPDGLEILLFGTSPDYRDTDADGFEDGAEVEAGSDPGDMISTPEKNGVIAGIVRAASELPGTFEGVNGVRVGLFDADGTALLDQVTTDPLFGRQGSFIFGIEGVDGPREYRVDILETPGEMQPLTPLPLRVRVDPYPPATQLEILLEGLPDRDGDHVPDRTEQHLGTDPSNPDRDGDGLPDGYEIIQRSNAERARPLDAGPFCCDPLTPDASADPDGDGIPNDVEMAQGTDPNGGNLPPCPGTESGQDQAAAGDVQGLVKVRLEGAAGGTSSIRGVQVTSLIPNTVTGRAFSALSGAGIQGARVFFYGGPGCPAGPTEGSCEVRSETNGLFWSLLQQAEYSIQVCSQGYYPRVLTHHVGDPVDSGFVPVELTPAGPEALSPDAWEALAGASLPTSDLASGSGVGPFRSRGVEEDVATRVLVVPLPVQRWGEPGGSRAAAGPGGPEESSGDGDLVNQQYRMDAQTELASGTLITRVEPDKLSRGRLELDFRPGDAATSGAPGLHEPDGRVTMEDAMLCLAMAAGTAEGSAYRRPMDVVSASSLHDAQGRLRFGQDHRVGLEDALAILRQAGRFLSPALPGSYQDLKQSEVFRFRTTGTSKVYVSDLLRMPLGETSLSGTVEIEVFSFPPEDSGSAFRILSMHGETHDPIRIPLPGLPFRVPVTFETWLEEGDLEGVTGTVVPEPTGKEGVYNVQIDGIIPSVAMVLPLGLRLTPELYQWRWKGVLFMDGAEPDSMRVQFRLPEMFAYTTYFDLMLDLEVIPREERR